MLWKVLSPKGFLLIYFEVLSVAGYPHLKKKLLKYCAAEKYRYKEKNNETAEDGWIHGNVYTYVHIYIYIYTHTYMSLPSFNGIEMIWT